MTKEEIKNHKEVYKNIYICLQAIKSKLPLKKITFIFERLTSMNPNEELSKADEYILSELDLNITLDLQDFEKAYKKFIKYHKEQKK